MTESSSIKHVIMVLSGKGGVGKSTVAVQLSLSLIEAGKKVGLLDIDICGPSVPQMLGLKNNEIEQGQLGWIPVSAGSLKVMSIAFLLKSKNDAVIWRGPKKHTMIKQFATDVYWGDLDFLIIDTPPGTSDEHMSILESFASFENKSGILVTTPQLVSIGDVRREVTFCEKTKLRVLGIVENMSGFECPNCKHCTQIFASAGGELLSKEAGIDLLAKIPIDPNLTKSAETGENYIQNFGASPACGAIAELRNAILARVVV